MQLCTSGHLAAKVHQDAKKSQRQGRKQINVRCMIDIKFPLPYLFQENSSHEKIYKQFIRQIVRNSNIIDIR